MLVGGIDQRTSRPELFCRIPYMAEDTSQTPKVAVHSHHRW
jgi:hypothetical protein